MKQIITKELLLKKFPDDFACRVWYDRQDSPVEYTSNKHINWKKVRRITVIFPKAKIKFDKNAGENVTRDGATFLITS